jgi:hypothetical protein
VAIVRPARKASAFALLGGIVLACSLAGERLGQGTT